MRIQYRTILLVAIVVLPSWARADDLPAAKLLRERSWSGALLEQVVEDATVDRSVRTLGQVQDFASKLLEKGLLKPAIMGRKVRWRADAHPHLQRLILRRVLDEGVPEPKPDQAFADLIAQQGRHSEQRTRDVADRVVAEMHASGQFDTEESFVPVRTGVGTLVISEVGSEKREEYVTGYRVVFRRHVKGVPVIGRQGELEVRFDANDEIEEVEVPTDGYHVGTRSLPAENGAMVLARALRRIGFAQRPRRLGEAAMKNGDEVTLEDVLCGLADDGKGARLRRACAVRYGGKSPNVELVPVD